MKEKRRCSILFHLLVPGGRWLTVISRPSSLASSWSSRFHSRTREPLLLPPPAFAGAGLAGSAIGCLGIARPTDGAPPLADAIDGERGRVMVNADTHPTRIGGEVVDPVRHRAAELLDQEVMDADFFRVALGAIFAYVVAVIADQYLFLGVDGDHRLPFGQRRGHLGVDVAELRIPVGVAVALGGLAVALQTVTRLVEQVGDQGATDLVTLRLQRLR